MPASLISLFPQVKYASNSLKAYFQAQAAFSDMASRGMEASARRIKNLSGALGDACLSCGAGKGAALEGARRLAVSGAENMVFMQQAAVAGMVSFLDQFARRARINMEFIDFLVTEPRSQHWHAAGFESNVLLDLPSMRLIDISSDGPHKIRNYTVVVAPRAGHHSNIAERTAVFMRESGLTRMAVVEQKCAADIPRYVNGKLHDEGFAGQVEQFTAILSHLKNRSGCPSHLVAVCQPGPLLMATLILHPELGRTFGCAGSPMHTEAEPGYLTDFARFMGEGYIDYLIDMFSGIIPEGATGAGRKIYDGRLQVLGFYFLGMEQHMKNFRRMYADLKAGNREGVERQKEFYEWYNWCHHFPAEFIRDTYKKIFVNNDLIHGRLVIGGRTVSIKDYPAHVPIWALGGSRDDIVPPRQGIGHLDEVDAVMPGDKLAVIADAGHMGIFRSRRVLREHYSKVVDFIIARSDFEEAAYRIAS